MKYLKNNCQNIIENFETNDSFSGSSDRSKIIHDIMPSNLPDSHAMHSYVTSSHGSHVKFLKELTAFQDSKVVAESAFWCCH